MFDGCTDIYELNLSSFDTSFVIEIGEMFRDCSSLKIIDLSIISYIYNINKKLDN